MSQSRERVLESLNKLQERLKNKPVPAWPPSRCGDFDTHLAGVFLREHLGLIIEAIRRLD